MLRAVRFEQRFDFEIEKRTLELLLEAQHLLSRVTGDRLRHELDHIVDEPLAVAMMDRLSELGLLSAIHPQLVWEDWHRERFLNLPIEDPGSAWSFGIFGSASGLDWRRQRRMVWYCLWLMRLPSPVVQVVCDRIHYPRTGTATIIAASQLWREGSVLTKKKTSQIVARLDALPPLAIFVNCLAYQDIEICETLRGYLTEWRYVSPTFTGIELRQRGIPPGPVYRRILNRVRDAWLDGEVKSSEAEGLLLERLIEEETSP
jgi:tRNA nucleotidyltransferase (CCA-adding enzyme)